MTILRSKVLCESEIHASTDSSFSTTDIVRLSKVAVSSVKYNGLSKLFKWMFLKVTNQCCPE